jgi:DNA-binding transcriptional MerR regulator
VARPSDPRLPEKQFFRIGEVAEIAAVEPYVLRFWETEFDTLAPKKSKSNQRRYSRKDVELVLLIRDLLYEEGYTIAGAKRQLRKRSGIEPPEVPARTRAVIDRVRRDVAALLQLVDE